MYTHVFMCLCTSIDLLTCCIFIMDTLYLSAAGRLFPASEYIYIFLKIVITLLQLL